ncbi:MAG TPA: glycosyltransferase family 2 protein [Thermoflexales bacterium]|nr:glycosyltransferase family 2 protein [Thermoflexales bacterium]
MPARVSVVIPTLDGQRWLPECLAALAAQTMADFEVVLIDNKGGEATRGFENGYAGLTITRIVNASNRGFAAAANQGLRAGEGAFAALLNDDTKPAPGWLDALLRAAEPPDVGACASLMVFDAAPGIVQSAGISVDRAAIAWDRLRGHPVIAAQAPAEVFGASGGAALYRRAMLDQIGMLDERFVSYLEDVDLAWRAQRTHWRCVYAPAAVVRHVTSATAGEGSRFKSRMLGRNKVWLAAKNSRWRDLPIVAGYDLAAVFYALVARRDPGPMLGRFDAIAGLPAALRARAGAGARARGLSPLVAPWHVPRRMG